MLKRVPVKMSTLLAAEYDRIAAADRPIINGTMLSTKEYFALLTRRVFLQLLRGELTAADIRKAGSSNAGKVLKEFRLPEATVLDIRRSKISQSVFLRGVICSEHEYTSRFALEAKWQEKYEDDPSRFSTGLLYMQLKAKSPVDKQGILIQRTLLGLERRVRDMEDKIEGLKSLSDRYLIKGLENSGVPPTLVELKHMTKLQLQFICGRYNISLDTRTMNTTFLQHCVAQHFGYSNA